MPSADKSLFQQNLEHSILIVLATERMQNVPLHSSYVHTLTLPDNK